MASYPLRLLLFFSILAVSSAQTLTKAAGILSDSGYTSMSAALDFAARSFTSQPLSLTVFAPADEAFPYSGQPSLKLLRYHLIPTTYHLRSLKSLPFSSKIPTLLDGHALTVTTLPSDGRVSLNTVTVTASPIFDDGELIIYGSKRFFDPYFRISGPIPSYGGKNRCCLAPKNPNGTAENAPETAAIYPFSDASKALQSKGWSVMASFLEMQFLGFDKYQTKLTVFAPVDDAMVDRIGDLSEYSSIFQRHLAPCKFSWNDLVSLDDGTVLRTHLRGFAINVSRYDGVLMLNGVSVVMPEIYNNDWLAVHGISEVLEFLPEQVVASSPDSAASPESEAVGNSSSEEDASPDESSPRTEPASEAIEVLSSPEFGIGNLGEFEAGESEMFANMTEDEAAISHRRFFVYRPA